MTTKMTPHALSKHARLTLVCGTLGLLAGSNLMGGCKNREAESAPAPQPTPWGSGSATFGPAYGPSTASAPVTASAPPPSSTPTATPPPPTSATASASAPPVAPFDPLILQTALGSLTKQKLSPGQKAEGTPMLGTVTPTQPLEAPLTLQPSGSKCYTVIAVGGPGISDLVVEFWGNPPAPLPPMPVLVAQSQGNGPNAVLGPKPDCYKNILPLPAPVTVKVKSRSGSGPVLAQVYAK